MNKKEVRFIPQEMRVKADEGERKKIVGYAAKFNSLSEEMWGFREQIAPGAFTEALKKSDVRALFNHDPNYILGRQSAGTVSLTEDDVGLHYEIDPPDTQWARDIVSSIERGDIAESSFAFSMSGGVEEWDDSATPAIRTIKSVGNLYDVSPVTYPAYPEATTGVRSGKEIYEEHQNERATEGQEEEAPDYGLMKARLDLAEID
jgi:uncharacterized protein